MKQHHGINTVEHTYPCDVCTKTFGRMGTLKVHQRVHTGERPYMCDMCNKTFSERSNLKVHKRLHAGEHPHNALNSLSFRIADCSSD